MVGAWLQGDVGSGANDGVPFGCRVAQRHDFGVSAAGRLGMALSYDALIAVCQYAANSRIRRRKRFGVSGQLKGTLVTIRQTYLQQFSRLIVLPVLLLRPVLSNLNFPQGSPSMPLMGSYTSVKVVVPNTVVAVSIWYN